MPPLITLHLMDQMDNELVATIERAVLRDLLTTKTGKDLGLSVLAACTITERDPRRSELDATDGFFSVNDHKDCVDELLDLLGR